MTWRFQVKFSATLTRADGRVVLSRPIQSLSQDLSWTRFTKAGVSPGWDEPPAREDLAMEIGDRLIEDLVHLR